MSMEKPGGVDPKRPRFVIELPQQEIKRITERFEAIQEEIAGLTQESEIVRKFDVGELTIEEKSSVTVDDFEKMKKIVALKEERNKLFEISVDGK